MKCLGTKAGQARANQRGVALVLSLLLVMVCASLGAAFTHFASASARRQSHAVAQLQAFYVAEAGLAEAFFSARMGRNGAIASEATPAHFGGAEIWVETFRSDSDTLYLRSTARHGRSNAVLGLIIRPEQPPLGFFADEDLIIEHVLLIDGFDSSSGPHAEEVARIEAELSAEPPTGAWSSAQISTFELARSIVQTFEGALTQTTLEAVLQNQVTVLVHDNPGDGAGAGGESTFLLTHSPIDVRDSLTSDQYDLFRSNGLAIYETHQAGVLFDEVLEVQPSHSDSAMLLDLTSGPSGWSHIAPDAPERLEGHTLSGALLGSNGNISFQASVGSGEIHGSVTPGVNGTVFGSDSISVSGSVESRAMPAALPPVVVPDLVSSGNWSITSGIPAVLSTPTARYGSLDIGPGEDLLLRGPMVLVVDDLTLADGARLALDTADGPVELYVRNSMQLSPAAFIDSTAAQPRDVSIQAEGNDLGTSHIAMEAIGAFHGAIYAPRSEVTLGTNFEVFGSVVAQRLTIQAGARLHFDDQSYDGELPIPKMESWRILELPEGSGTRPAPSIEGANLADAHDMVDVRLSIEYVNQNGVTQRYSGLESDFDYSNVVKVSKASRIAVTAPTSSDAPDWMTAWIQKTVEAISDAINGGL